MKRKFFSCFMFASLIGAGMLSVTSCADYDEDIRVLQQQVTDHTKVNEALQNQVNGMEAEIKSLQDALNAMKSCNCGDVDQKIADAISKALAGLNYTTPDQVADAISKALAGLNTGLTADEVQALIDAYHAAHPGCQCGDIQALIEKYLKDNPGLSEADVEAIVKAYHDAHPQSTLSENDVKSIVETYINQLQHFTKEQIEAMINTAITQALAGYVQKSEVYTKSQVEDLVNAAIAEALKGITHPESGLSQSEVEKLIADAIAKIQHPESGLSQSEVEKLIADALKNIKPGLTEAEVKALIEAAKCNCPALTTTDVTTIATSVIEKYMQDHPYTLDTAAVESICNNVINNSQVINDIKGSITTLQGAVDKVKEDLQNLKDNVYTKSEVENLINTLIAQAIKNCNCDNTALSAEQQAIINNLITQAINNFSAAHPDCNCQYDATAFQALVDAVAANTNAIKGLQPAGDYVTGTQLADAIEEVKKLVPTIPDLSAYVTVATYNADMVLVNQSIAAADAKAQQALDKATEALDSANSALNLAGDNKVLIDNLTTTVNNLGDLYLSLSTKLDETTHKAEVALNRALSNYFEIEALKQLLGQLDADLNEKLTNLGADLNDKIEASKYDDTALKQRITDLEGELATLKSQVETLATKDELAAQLATVQGLVEDAKAHAQTVASNAAAQALADAKDYAKNYTDTQIGVVRNEFADADQLLQNQINTINGALDDIDETLTGLQSQIDAVTGRLGKVENALTKLITGIELQGSTNPAFGYYSLPVGITSNVLIAYYGENDEDVDFPTIEDGSNLVYTDEENWITEADAYRIGMPSRHLTGKTGYLVNGTGNAGKLYLTINPSNVDFTGTQLKLVNSQGKESSVTLSSLQPSGDKLTFGQTRINAKGGADGFYEATATVKKDKVNDVNYGINEQLTTVLKDLKNNSLGSNISGLAQAVYNQFNGVLDAYAVQATWTDDYGTHTVTSNYNIAATAIKPLSFNTLYGVNVKLPTVTPLSEMGLDLKKIVDPKKFNFSIKDVNVDFKLNIDFSDLYVKEDGSVWSDITVTEPNKQYEKTPVQIMSASEVASHQFNKTQAELIVAILNDRSNAWSAQLTDEFTKQFADNIGKMQNEINDAVASVGGKLEGAVGDIIDNVQNKLNSVLKTGDRFIAQLNKLISTINDKLLSNPNLRLQGHVFYTDAHGLLHPMSTAKGIPTVFSGNGEAIELNLSSYTGEILAPAYKKYVAVTNVYKNGQDADSSSELMEALKAANSVEYFNTIFNGDRYAVAFHPTVKDAVYEIVYSALDFHGYTSQRKFYVHVK